MTHINRSKQGANQRFNHTYEYPPLLELCECDELFIYLSEGNYIFDRSIQRSIQMLPEIAVSILPGPTRPETPSRRTKPTSFLTSSRGLSKSVMESSFSPNT